MLVSPIKNSLTFKEITETKRHDAEKIDEATAIKPNPKTESNSQQQNQPPCNKHNKYNPVSITGWSAAGLLGVAMVSGMTHHRTLHKISAMLGACSVAAHVGILYGNHHKHHCDVKA